VTAPPMPLPDTLQNRLDVMLAKPLFRRAPAVAQALSMLVRDACARRADVARPALVLADRHQPAALADGAPGLAYCARCGSRQLWPCREAVLAAEILHALGHALPYPLPRRGHPAYSPDPSPENEGAGGPANSYNQAPDWVR
jgi:hypothetical protein